MSQAELARLAGVTRVSVCRYERGQVDPTTAQLNRILAPLGLEVTVQTRRADTPADVLSDRLDGLIADYPNLPDRGDDDWGAHDGDTGRRLTASEHKQRVADNKRRYEVWKTKQNPTK